LIQNFSSEGQPRIAFYSFICYHNLNKLYEIYFHMKKDIHPKYFDNAEVTCACGAKFTVGSTVEKMKVEICSQCHPFYTGQKKIIDTAGRVQRFETRMKKTEALKTKKSVQSKIEGTKKEKKTHPVKKKKKSTPLEV